MEEESSPFSTELFELWEFFCFVFCKKSTRKLDFNDCTIVTMKNRKMSLMIAVTVIVLCHDLIFVRLENMIL